MLKTYDKLWVFGDSYTTTNFYVDAKDSFWGLCALTLGIETIINCSRPGNSFTSVQHLLTGMSDKINWNNDVVLVGIPPLERITIFDNYKDTAYQAQEINLQAQSIDQFSIPYHHGLVCLKNYGDDRQLILHSDRSWLETDVLRQVFLLTAWLDSVGAQYVIVNLSKDLDENNVWGPSDFVLPYCKKHQNCILFKNTYHSINIDVNKPADFAEYGWTGHHGPAGNKHFFENSLLLKLKELNLC